MGTLLLLNIPASLFRPKINLFIVSIKHTYYKDIMNAKIKLDELYKSFGTKKILQGVNLEINPGEILCIIGKSGTGKSVILKHLIGLMQPDSGNIFVDGINFTTADSNERFIIQNKFGVLFQGAALFDSMNIYDNVAFGLRRQKISEEEIARMVPEMLTHVGLKGVNDKMPGDLSGGMQKRVALARAIAIKPEIMLYDEPTTGVDPITGGAVDRLISHMRDSFGITSVVITHDMHSAYRIADRIAMLYDGKIIKTGKPEEFQNSDDPVIQQFIEGRANGPIKVI